MPKRKSQLSKLRSKINDLDQRFPNFLLYDPFWKFFKIWRPTILINDIFFSESVAYKYIYLFLIKKYRVTHQKYNRDPILF